MDGNDKATNTVDFNQAKVVSTYKDISRQILDSNDTVTRLTRRLQTSLEIRTIIEIFTQELTELIEPGQLKYETPNGTEYRYGEASGSHSCQFNLAIENTRLGKLSVCRRKRYSEDEISIIEYLASTLVFPLKNALLYKEALESALTDALTGMGNRRALDANLHREAERSVRHNKPLSVVILDLDHFKLINDTYGHQAGDEVLVQAAQLIKNNFRKGDLRYRYGGEEFLLILDETSSDQAKVTAERLRTLFEAHEFNCAGNSVSLTVSVGYTSFEHGESLKDFVGRADEALYRAKRLGRNQSICLSTASESALIAN